MAITYAPTTNFGLKDSLPTNDSDKVIRGSEFTTEFTAIQTAFSLAAPTASPTFTGTVTIASVDINGGNIDGTVIGAATPAAGSFTTGQFDTSLNVDGTVTADGLTAGAFISNTSATSPLAAIASTGEQLLLQGTTNGVGQSVDLLFEQKTTTAASRAGGKISSIAVDSYTAGSGTTNDADLVFYSAKDGTDTQRLRIESNGDISFYEDTGTTPKFFWDASAEALGLGTSSPSGALHTYSSAANNVYFEGNTGNSNVWITSGDAQIARIMFGDQTNNSIASVQFNNSDNSIAFTNSGLDEKMRITSAGNVGIGTASPSAELEVAGTGDVNGAVLIVDDAGSLGIEVQSDNPTILFKEDDTTDQNYQIRLAGGDLNFQTQNDARNAAATKMTLTSAGNVGIGTSSPSGFLANKLVIATGGTANEGLTIYSSSNNGSVWFADATTGNGRYAGGIDYQHATNEMIFYTNSLGSMRLDASGNLLVGTTTITGVGGSSSPEGVVLDGNNAQITVGTSSDVCATFNRQTTDGAVVQFRKDGTTVGQINAFAGALAIGGPNSGIFFNGNGMEPTSGGSTRVDNTENIGAAAWRFKDIYATNGTIQTSDANEKQDIEELSEAERRVAVAAKGLLRKFRWISSVEEKGDEARIHFGIIAQDLEAAFEAEGLDAGRYGMFIHSTWADEETGEERSRMGVRYSELLAFIIAAI